MAIYSSDLHNFFTHLGIDADDRKTLRCPLCGSPIYQKNSQYQCKNLHFYSYTDVIYDFVEFHYNKSIMQDDILCSSK